MDLVIHLSLIVLQKKGYSKFGSFVGNGNADGTFIYTGFRPSFIFVQKKYQVHQNWHMQDNKRDVDNPIIQD